MADSSRKRKQTDIQDFAVVKKFTHSTPTKDLLMREKKHSFSLSSHILVYAREEDPEDTLILRSIYPDCPKQLRRYGVNGTENIKHLFLAILKLVGAAAAEEIYSKTRYLTTVQINACFELIQEQKDEIEKMEFETASKETSSNNVFTYTRLPNKDQLGITTTKFTQLCFFKNSENNQRTGIFLFFGEILKLLKYINSKYNFSQHKSFVNRKQDPSNMKDNFF